jgi:hypothetical protein
MVYAASLDSNEFCSNCSEDSPLLGGKSKGKPKAKVIGEVHNIAGTVHPEPTENLQEASQESSFKKKSKPGFASNKRSTFQTVQF